MSFASVTPLTLPVATGCGHDQTHRPHGHFDGLGSVGMLRRDGFQDQRLCVVPRPTVERMLRRPVTRRLMVTDAGYFPHAEQHGRTRPHGAHETIVIVCTDGSGWLDIAGQRYGVGAGSVVVLPSQVPHSYGASRSRPWTIWWAHLRGSDCAELLAHTGASRERPVLSLRTPERCVALIDEVIGMLEQDTSPVRLAAAAGAAWKLMTQIGSDQALPTPGDPLQRAMDYLAERLDSSLKVPELAALVGVSPSHLSALFRHATGGGVLAHHTSLKMARARQLLDTTSLPVRAVAAEVGYSDAFYFSRHFSKMHGQSPTDYRAHRKG